MEEDNITTLFLDIGGVLLTNGWDMQERHLAAIHFDLDEDEMNERHHLISDIYESGKLTLDEYLDRIVFYRQRDFSKTDFTKFMFDQSQPIKGSIEFFKGLKEQYQLRVMAVSNEARELNEFRIQKYKLNQLFDCFVSSCYVHLRKPDVDIFHMACNIAQTPLSNILFIDDRDICVEAALSLNITSYRFLSLAATEKYMKTLNFAVDSRIEKVNH